MLNKANFLVTEFASKEESRYTMQAILVRPDATVATNGYYLAWISTNGMDPASFPVVEGFDGGHKEWAPFLLDTEAAKQIAKSLPKKNTIPVLGYAAVHVKGVTVDLDGVKTEDQSKGIAGVQLCTTDLQRPQIFRPHVPEGKFPNWEAVIPDWEKDVVVEISLDADYLATIAKTYTTFLKDKDKKPIRLKFYKADESTNMQGKLAKYDRAVRFDATNTDGQGMTVVLMPFRDEGDLPGTYGYKDRQAARELENGLKHMPEITLERVISHMKSKEDYPEGTIDSLRELQAQAS